MLSLWCNMKQKMGILVRCFLWHVIMMTGMMLCASALKSVTGGVRMQKNMMIYCFTCDFKKKGNENIHTFL